MRRIYLDNAATSWPKPDVVYAAVDDYQRRLGAPAGRGSYAEAEEVDRRLADMRAALARWIHAERADTIALAYSGTDALMLALQGLLRPGDHVVTTVLDHNAVLRPLRHGEQVGRLAVTRLMCNAAGYIDAETVLAAVRPNTRLVVMSHASNVTGAVQPIESIGQALATCQPRPFFLVDAAQTVGHIPINVQQAACDLLAAPAHKGLLGPLGTGFLYVSPRVGDHLEPIRLGGTGTSSDSDDPPRTMPQRLEAGNLNVPGWLGVHAALKYLAEGDHAAQTAAANRRIDELQNRLAALPGVRIWAPAPDVPRVPVLSWHIAGWDPHEVAVGLEQIGHIQVRSGFHCAPLAHQALGTMSLGGTVRISWGPFNQAEDAEELIRAVEQLIAES